MVVGVFTYGNSTDRKENFNHKEIGMSEVVELHTVSCITVRDISEKKSVLSCGADKLMKLYDTQPTIPVNMDCMLNTQCFGCGTNC